MCISALAYAGLITPILKNATTVAAGAGVNMPQYPNRWFQATLTASGAASATVEVDGSTDNTNWVPIVTITLPNTGTGAYTDAVATAQTAPYVRGNVTAISGVNAAVTLVSGE